MTAVFATLYQNPTSARPFAKKREPDALPILFSMPIGTMSWTRITEPVQAAPNTATIATEPDAARPISSGNVKKETSSITSQ